MIMNESLTPQQAEMLSIFQTHMNAELEGNLEITMETMSENPHLNHVPVIEGGEGRDGVRQFYRNHLVGKFFPPDVKITPVSETIGSNRIVDELVISFTHTVKIDWLLPGIEPTGKPLLIAFVVIVGFEGSKISYEHIYWDQASVLVQVGLLNHVGLPVTGSESAEKILNPGLPSRIAY
jgi:carboxymethylenebutenolidase